MRKGVAEILSFVLGLSGFAFAESETGVSFIVNGNKTVITNYVAHVSIWNIYSNYFLATLSALVVVAIIYISSKSNSKKKSGKKRKVKKK